ncbi:hypothetical protein F5X96DRAFT_4451 [Biscogniauxia mediterranea]|nr:hypothetical protein F5X96DRAFT_4451 [Biscogniauxia mediterranea]
MMILIANLMTAHKMKDGNRVVRIDHARAMRNLALLRAEARAKAAEKAAQAAPKPSPPMPSTVCPSSPQQKPFSLKPPRSLPRSRPSPPGTPTPAPQRFLPPSPPMPSTVCPSTPQQEPFSLKPPRSLPWTRPSPPGTPTPAPRRFLPPKVTRSSSTGVGNADYDIRGFRNPDLNDIPPMDFTPSMFMPDIDRNKDFTWSSWDSRSTELSWHEWVSPPEPRGALENLACKHPDLALRIQRAMAGLPLPDPKECLDLSAPYAYSSISSSSSSSSDSSAQGAESFGSAPSTDWVWVDEEPWNDCHAIGINLMLARDWAGIVDGAEYRKYIRELVQFGHADPPAESASPEIRALHVVKRQLADSLTDSLTDSLADSPSGSALGTDWVWVDEEPWSDCHAIGINTMLARDWAGVVDGAEYRKYIRELVQFGHADPPAESASPEIRAIQEAKRRLADSPSALSAHSTLSPLYGTDASPSPTTSTPSNRPAPVSTAHHFGSLRHVPIATTTTTIAPPPPPPAPAKMPSSLGWKSLSCIAVAATTVAAGLAYAWFSG